MDVVNRVKLHFQVHVRPRQHWSLDSRHVPTWGPPMMSACQLRGMKCQRMLSPKSWLSHTIMFKIMMKIVWKKSTDQISSRPWVRRFLFRPARVLWLVSITHTAHRTTTDVCFPAKPLTSSRNLALPLNTDCEPMSNIHISVRSRSFPHHYTTQTRRCTHYCWRTTAWRKIMGSRTSLTAPLSSLIIRWTRSFSS